MGSIYIPLSLNVTDIMSNPNIPPAVREEINQAQQLEEKLQALNQRISFTQNSIMDIEKTLKDLEDVEEDAVVYKNAGLVLIQSTKNKIVEDLTDELSNLQVRIKNFKLTHEKSKTEYEELRKKIIAKLPQQPQ